jgi:hypothetical protein
MTFNPIILLRCLLGVLCVGPHCKQWILLDAPSALKLRVWMISLMNQHLRTVVSLGSLIIMAEGSGGGGLVIGTQCLFCHADLVARIISHALSSCLCPANWHLESVNVA